MTQMNLSTKQKQTHRHREQTCGCQGGEWGGGGMDWEFAVSRCKLFYEEWINNKVLPVPHRELYLISRDKPSWKII